MVRFIEDEFTCLCGNTARLEGFSPCLRSGIVVEAVAVKDWKGFSLMCNKCNGVHKNPNFSEDNKPLRREIAA